MKNIRKNKNSENEIAVTGKSGIFWLKGLAGFYHLHALRKLYIIGKSMNITSDKE